MKKMYEWCSEESIVQSALSKLSYAYQTDAKFSTLYDMHVHVRDWIRKNKKI